MINKLIKALKEDKELYYGYQSNIAVSFQDCFAESKKRYKNRQDIHEISNSAAKRFLDLLIKG